ncbi:MAG: hypothetical protein EXR62_12535 [Chloroflexi bacterium]|nr:hypothetical protein [Chloroflexota bacterium]
MDIAHISNRRQFWFNSQKLISETEHLAILQSRAQVNPSNPVLVPNQPWESVSIAMNNSVDYDPQTGKWQLWYESFPAGVMVYTAFSDDGVYWQKPALGVCEFNGRTDNNIVLQTGYWDANATSVVRAPHETDPARRYKLYFWIAPAWFRPENPAHAATGNRIKDYSLNGHHIAFSPDGIHWTPKTDAPVLAGRTLKTFTAGSEPDATGEKVLGIGDINSVIFDEQRGRYRSSHKLDKLKPGWDMPRRCCGMAESDDGVHFEPSISTLDPDAADNAWAQSQGGLRTEFYGMNVWPQDGFYLGLLWVFLVNKTGQPPYGRGWDDGPIASHLIYSADGLKWQRLPVREPFIPLGSAGSFDAGCLYAGNRPVVVGDTVRFYYIGVRGTHGEGNPEKITSGIGLATLPRDRYVGWQGNALPGKLQTGPLTFSGQALHLNLDASRGESRVALLDGAGSPLPGYSLEDCDPLAADGLDQVVSWRGSRDVSALAGQALHLQFALRQSTLYTWQFV